MEVRIGNKLYKVIEDSVYEFLARVTKGDDKKVVWEKLSTIKSQDAVVSDKEIMVIKIYALNPNGYELRPEGQE